MDAYNQAFQFGLAEYDSWLNLGEAYHILQGREDRAADAYAQAVRLGRERIASRARDGRSFDVMVPANLATVFPRLGQPDSARAYLRWALATDSTMPSARSWDGRAGRPAMAHPPTRGRSR